MTTIVLVHGAWHGAWCWKKLTPHILARGHKVVAPDLPGHGMDKTPPRRVTMKAYVERVQNVIAEQDEPVVLMGHSMGGIVISQVAEQYGDKIQRLVYLAAFMLRDGDNMLEAAGRDKYGVVLPNLIIAPDKRSVTVHPDYIKQGFFNRCDPADVEFAKARLAPQATAPFSARLKLSEANYGMVPRSYITCRYDQAISFPMQQSMIEATPCQSLHTLDCGHSAFLSNPEQLANLVQHLANLPAR